MARRLKSSALETRTARLRMPVNKKPTFTKIGPGLGLGYRRNETAGTWVLRLADGRGGNMTKAIGAADDYDEADGQRFLSYWQAQDAARTLAGKIKAGGTGTPECVQPATVAKVLDVYEADLRTRKGDAGNVARVRAHLPESLLGQLVTELTTTCLRSWRDGLVIALAAATVNRTCTALKAALNLAAQHDERITNRHAWEIGLASLHGAEESRNVILTDSQVRAIIVAANQFDANLGAYVEVAAMTGARPSQMAKLSVADLHHDGLTPFLMVPTSAKGRGQKAVLRRRNPITVTLAERLLMMSKGRAIDSPLLTKSSGAGWRKSDHYRPFQRVVASAGLDPDEVTIYALRHSSIVRQLLAGVPTRIVAASHDTSVAMLEHTYSRHIGDHADQIVRAGLLAAE